jgi:hypothetical protein
MKRHHLLLGSATWLAAAAFAGCEARCSTANIHKAFMAKDAAGTQPTTAYAPGDEFWCVVHLANAPDSTEFRAALVAVETTGGNAKDIVDFKLTTGSAVIPVHLTLPNPWPTGKYKVELYLDGKLVRTVDFQVKADADAAPPAGEAVTAPPSGDATPPPPADPGEAPGDDFGGEDDGGGEG